MNKKIIPYVTITIFCVSIPVFLLLKSFTENEKRSVKAKNQEFISNSVNKSTEIHAKEPVEVPHPYSYPTTLSKKLLPIIKPMVTKKYDGTDKGVQEYVSYLLKNQTPDAIPDEYKNKFSDTRPGTPLFVKDERDPLYDILQDVYVVPLVRGNTIVGQCSVAIWGDELTFAEISGWQDSSDSIFSRKLNEIFDKVRAKARLELKNYQLVVKPDYKDRTSMYFLDPQLKITAVDGQIFYYSTKGLILSKSEADEYSSTKYGLPGGS